MTRVLPMDSGRGLSGKTRKPDESSFPCPSRIAAVSSVSSVVERGPMKIAIIAITRNGAQLGARLKEGFADASLFVLQKYAGAAGKDAIPFCRELNELVRQSWRQYRGFVFSMATGIVVRLIAPHLEGKERDPAVVVMDDAGKFAISLLSGHLGGANELACKCAFLSGAREVITTATDANCLPSFDMLARDDGWAIEDLSRVKTLNA